jgi:hypothetical protein
MCDTGHFALYLKDHFGSINFFFSQPGKVSHYLHLTLFSSPPYINTMNLESLKIELWG